MAGKGGLLSYNVGTNIIVEEFSADGVIDGNIVNVPKIDPNNVFSKFEIDGKKLSPNEITLLVNLEKNGKLFDFDNPEKKIQSLTLLGEFGQLFIEKGFSTAYSELLAFCSSNKTDFTWESTSLIEEKERVDLINETEIKVEARDDIGFCNNCKSKWLTQSQVQNRASDEALKTTYKCAKCKAGKFYLTLY